MLPGAPKREGCDVEKGTLPLVSEWAWPVEVS